MEDIIAVKKFKEGFNCAQSVLYHYSERLGINVNLALRLATGFGGGMGRRQEICGAISGGILVISYIYGRDENQPKEQQYLVYDKVRQLIDQFEIQTGEICCLKLLDNCNLLQEEGQQRFIRENMKEKCYSYLRTVVEILDSKIFD